MFWLLLSIVLWGIIHSLLASTGLKQFLHRTFGKGFMRFFRLLYNVFAVVSFLPILYLMIALPDRLLYQVPVPLSYLMYAGQGLSVLLLIAAVFQTDLLSFAGLRQLVEEEKRGPLITSGLYRYVRHPLYTFSLTFLWLTPRMTVNAFIVYLSLTLYILVGIFFEERKLVRVFGEEYEGYRSETPMLIPGRKQGWNK